MAAFTWAVERLGELGGDLASGSGLAGDSAGGAIAVLAAARLRGQPGAVSSLLLAYPNADMTLSQPSVEQEGHGWGLDADDLRWFVEQWIPDPRDRDNPAFSPVRADLGGLPPAVVATAGHDPLRDEGGLLARLMREPGGDVTYVPHPGLVHGFLGLGDVSAAARLAGDDLFRRYGAVVHRLAGAGAPLRAGPERGGVIQVPEPPAMTYDHSSLLTPTGGGASPPLRSEADRCPCPNAGEFSQAWNESSSRHRVTTSHVVRSSVGLRSSNPSKPSWLSTAPARAANRRASSSPLSAGTVIALIFTTVMCR